MTTFRDRFLLNLPKLTDMTPEHYTAILEELCQKLQVVEPLLYGKFSQTQERQDAEAWLTAQNQLRITAVELMKRQPSATAKPASPILLSKLKKKQVVV